MLPCVDMSLLAVNCVLLLHPRGCRERRRLAGKLCRHPGGQLGKGACSPCSPSLDSHSRPSAPRVYGCKTWEHQCQTQAIVFPPSSKSSDHKALALMRRCSLDVPLRFDETKEQRGREREKEVRKERG